MSFVSFFDRAVDNVEAGMSRIQEEIQIVIREVSTIVLNTGAEINPANVHWYNTAQEAERRERDRRAAEVFSEDYREDFIGIQIPGADNPRLNELMEQLMSDNPGDIDSALADIAAIRGIDPDEFAAQYQDYLDLIAEGGAPSPLDLNKFPDHLGSTANLRYGYIVGEVLDIDPVFGALLRPDGGITGPGGIQLIPAGDNNSNSYHTAFHDAAGYLHSRFDVDTSYNYTENPFDDLPPIVRYLFPDFDALDPYTGQVSGLIWWGSQPGLDIEFYDYDTFLPNPIDNYIGSYINNTIGGPLHSLLMLRDMQHNILNGEFDDAWDQFTSIGPDLARDGLQHLIATSGLVSWGLATASDLAELGQAFGNEMIDYGQSFGNGVINGGQDIGNTLVNNAQNHANGWIDNAQYFVPSSFGNMAVDGLQIAGNGIVNDAQMVGNEVVDGLQTAGNEMVDGAQAVGNGMVDGAQAVGNGLANGINNGAEAIGDFFGL